MQTAYIFGTGQISNLAYEQCKEKYKILGFIDNDNTKHGKTHHGLLIEPPSKKLDCVDAIIIGSADANKDEMEIQLVNDFGIPPDRLIAPIPSQPLDSYTSKNPPGLSISLGSDKCINRCIICPQHLGGINTQFLSPDVLKKVVSEIPEEEFNVTLTGFLEPFLAPNIVECARTIKQIKPKAKIMVNTAGLIYDEDFLVQLFPYLSVLKVSLNTMTSDDYAFLSGTGNEGNFHKVMDNILKFQNLSIQKYPNLKITLQMMKFKKYKYKDLTHFLAPFRQKGVAVHYCDVYNWGGGNNDRKKITSELHNRELLPMLRTPQGEQYPCLALFTSIHLFEDGYYYPCPPSMKHGQDGRDFPIGNALTMSFSEAYHVLQTYQQMHLQNEFNCLDCATCNGWTIHNKNIFENHKKGCAC
ncbi:MAG: radical SAM protein [Defluviitaleaceae bacterium]|nr:radical SAM protein [Defluviitaleaceae bacterium]